MARSSASGKSRTTTSDEWLPLSCRASYGGLPTMRRAPDAGLTLRTGRRQSCDGRVGWGTPGACSTGQQGTIAATYGQLHMAVHLHERRHTGAGQLHQAQRIGRTPTRSRLSADCQQITSRDLINTLSVDRFRPLQASRGSRVVVLGGSSSGHGRPWTAAHDPWSRSWPTSWGQACGGRRRRRPGRRGPPVSRQFDPTMRWAS
jgi:hypothetical protein